MLSLCFNVPGIGTVHYTSWLIFFGLVISISNWSSEFEKVGEKEERKRPLFLSSNLQARYFMTNSGRSCKFISAHPAK